jgi:hypothetical protein
VKLSNSRALLWLAATLLCSSSAVAGDSYFDFSFSGSGDSGSGVLGGVSLGGGEYFINYVSGTDNGNALTLLSTATPWTGTPACLPGIPCYTASGYIFDDVLFTKGALALDYAGLGLRTAVTGGVNVIGMGSGYQYSDHVLGGTYVPISFSASAVAKAPEIDPVSAASGATLLIGSLFVLRGRRMVGLVARRLGSPLSP